MATSTVRTWMRNLVLLAVIAVFVIYFGMPTARPVEGPVAEVDGEPIRREVFEAFREQNEAARRLMMPEGAQPDEAQLRELLDNTTLANLVNRYVLAREAEVLGIHVSDDEIRAEIRNDPGFQRNGAYDPELVRIQIARRWGTERIYTAEVRRDLLIRKLRRLIQSPVRIGDAEIRDAVERSLVKVRLRFVEARTADYLERAQPDAAEIERLIEEEPDRVQGLYDRRRFEFQRAESVVARHILFVGPNGVERAEAARARIEAGEAFEDVAREVSDDEATAESGGDLGEFPRGRLNPVLEEAAFSLDPGALSDPIETDRGVHLLRVEEHREAVDRSIEEVQEELASELLREDVARRLASEAASRMAEMLRDGQDFEFAAGEAGLEVRLTPPFAYTEPEVPLIGRVPGLREAAFELDVSHPDLAAVFTAGSGSRFLLISLADREEPDAETLAAETARLRDQALESARRRVMGRWMTDRVNELQRGGKIVLYPLYGASS